MLMLHNFGTAVNGGLVFERPTTPDGANDTPAPPRPNQGLTVQARPSGGGSALAPFTTQAGGHWAVGYDDVPSIDVSADGGTTWIGPLWSDVSIGLAVASGDTSAQAIQTAQAAQATAQEALDHAISGGGAIESVNGQTGAVTLGPSDVGARSASIPVPAGDVSGLATVATSGSFLSLADRPAAAIPLTDKGTSVATLTGGKLTPAQVPANVGRSDLFQLSDGTWPLRNSVTSDPASIASWWQYAIGSPLPQAGNGYFQGRDVLYVKA